MLTLSQATAETRVALKWGGITLAILFIIFLIYRGGTALTKALFPTPSAPPSVSFGKLPLIVFPNNVSDKNFNYSLDTVTGSLPAFPDRVNVYKMSQIPPDLLALSKAKSKVSRVGFTNPELSISAKIYQWNSDDPLNKSITMDVFSNDFALSSTFISDPTVISALNLPDSPTAISTAQNFLSSMYSFPDDIDASKTKTLLFSINNNTLTTATSLSSAQVIEVDFFQKDVNNLPIYYPKAVNSTMNAFVVGGKDQAQVAQVNFSYQAISDQFGTYPIKTAKVAFDLLKQGQGYIASYFGTTTDIAIKNVFLAYYIGEKKQQYLFPVVVFQGDNGFFAYVPVVTDEWTGN